MTFGINGAELIILALLAVLILGPEKLPAYARKLTEWIRNLRRMAEGAKTQFKEETGTDFDEIDWKKYDPRQYDPRRIIKDALADPVDGATDGPAAASTTGSAATSTTAARGGLRGELDSARTHRDDLRNDLKDMDPRALFFGKSSSRSGTGTAAGSETGTAAGAAAASAAAGTGHPASQPAGADTSWTERAPEEATGAAGPETQPAPFDLDAT